jgi:site-specific recombinase XerC
MTVGQLLDEYLDGIDTDGRLSPKTRHDYRRNADAYVRPWLGEHRVRALTPEAILAWQRQLSEGTGTRRGRPLAPNTVRLARASLAGAVRLAVESGVLRTNPLASVQQPKARRSTPRHWLPKQAREFLASQAGHRLYPLWAFLLGSGLRIGELVWLRWRRTIRAGESQAIPPSVVHSVDLPDGAVLSVDFLTRPWRHQEAPPGGATWR